MAPTDERLAIAEHTHPHHVCFVPEKREELTTEGGYDVVTHEELLTQACTRLQKQGIQVSLFIDPNSDQIDAAKRCGADVVEFHTGYYANAIDEKDRKLHLEVLLDSVTQAVESGLIANAGHGLHYHNVQAVARIIDIHELNIGHSIVTHALYCGLPEAVKEMRHLIDTARSQALMCL